MRLCLTGAVAWQPARTGAPAGQRRTIDVAGALEEGVHHPAHRLVEHHADRGLQDAAAEFEIDEEVDLGAAGGAA